MFLKTTIVVYSKSQPKDLPAICRTTIAFYDDNNVTMHFLEGDQFFSPPTSVPTICLWYCGIHYQHIVLYDYDLPTFKWRQLELCHNLLSDDVQQSSTNSSNNVQHQTPTKSHPQDQEDDGDCKIVDEQGSTSCDIADPSLSSLRYTSKVVLGQRSPTSDNIKKRESVGGVHYVHYHPVLPEEIIINIKSEVLIGNIVVAHDGNQLTSYGFAPGLKKKGTLFKELIKESGRLPAHIDLRCQNSTTVRIPSGRGKRAAHSYLILFTGACSQNKHTRSKKKSNDDKNDTQCSTTWFGGIDYENLLSFAKKPVGSHIELRITIQGRCCHREDKVYGQVRGAKRQEEIKEVRQ
jgi:hypothetical protein